MCQECDTAQLRIICSKKKKTLCQESPKMDFQDQFIAIIFGNISPTVLKKINDFKFLGKKKVAAKVLLTLLAKVLALYYQAISQKKIF